MSESSDPSGLGPARRAGERSPVTTARVLPAALLVVTLMTPASPAAQAPRPGLAPSGPWACPATHPIKGYLSQSGTLVYFVPAHPFYDEASPERCYRTEDEARADGAGPARGWANIYPLV
jgi:hypothetical protein